MALAALLPFPSSAADNPTRPNIGIFTSDDHSQLDSEVYGARDLRTPNMLRLAEAGLTFTHAFVASPACAPSRAALLTGLMPARNGAEANHSKPRPEIKKLPAYFHDLGYEVAAFGKVAHYNHDPEYGFDHYDKRHARQLVAEYLSQRDSSKPLCLFVGAHAPHVPWSTNSPYDPGQIKIPPTHVDTPQTRLFRTHYYADVSKADRELGETYDLAREKFGTNLLFIYTSDHGAQWPFGKWNLYDAGTRVPFIACWPGVIKPQTTTGAMVSWIDILPTIVEAAGGKPPQGIDGRSFLPIFKGETSAHRDRIFTTHSGDGRMNVYPIRSVRTPQWKYIRNLHPEFRYTTHIDLAQNRDGVKYWRTWEAAAEREPKVAAIVSRYRQRPPEELYDLSSDPFEQQNLANDPAHAERLASLRAELERWMNEQDDQRTVFNDPRLLSN